MGRSLLGLGPAIEVMLAYPAPSKWDDGHTLCPPSPALQLAQCAECRAELGSEQLGLLPGREVPALVDRVEVDQVVIGAPGPGLRRSIDVIGKDGDRHWQRDLVR